MTKTIDRIRMPAYNSTYPKGEVSCFKASFEVVVLCKGVNGTEEVKLFPPFAFITNLSIIVEAEEALVKNLFLFFRK